MSNYTAVATRDGKYWLIHILDLDQYTQARTLAEVELMARELISLTQGVPDDSFELEWRTDLPDTVQHHLELAAKYANEAAWYQTEAATQRRFAARAMRDAGMTVRDIGAALGVSHQRAQQLIASPHDAQAAKMVRESKG